MRYGIIGDIHSNLEALREVIHACWQEKVQTFLCVGDIVGYGANPKECLDVLRGVRAVSVAGNHDWAVCGKLNPANFTADGKEAALWTKTNAREEDLNFLKRLPLVLQNESIALAHAALNVPEMFIYMVGTAEAANTFRLMERNVCFIGHTHVPKIMMKEGGHIFICEDLKIEPHTDNKYIVNIGSVGQPRDGNPKASYCIYDTDLNTIEVKRIAYDIKTAQKKILEAGLPQFLAERLSIGE